MLFARSLLPPFVFESLERRRLLAADLVLDAMGLSAASSIEINGTSYFFADDGIHGRELWKTDGSPQGTVLVKDLTPGAAGTNVDRWFHAGERVVFLTVVQPHAYDFTVWSSDGSAAGNGASQSPPLPGVAWEREVDPRTSIYSYVGRSDYPPSSSVTS